MQTTYMQLILARDSNVAEDLRDYDGDDTRLLDCYVTAGCNDDTYEDVYADAEELDIAETKTVQTAFVYGGYETRCYSNTIQVVVDKQGKVWMDADLYDEVFC